MIMALRLHEHLNEISSTLPLSANICTERAVLWFAAKFALWVSCTTLPARLLGKAGVPDE